MEILFHVLIGLLFQVGYSNQQYVCPGQADKPSVINLSELYQAVLNGNFAKIPATPPIAAIPQYIMNRNQPPVCLTPFNTCPQVCTCPQGQISDGIYCSRPCYDPFRDLCKKLSRLDKRLGQLCGGGESGNRARLKLQPTKEESVKYERMRELPHSEKFKNEVYEDEVSSIEESFESHRRRRRKPKYERRSEKDHRRNKDFGSEEIEHLTAELFDVDQNKGYKEENSEEDPLVDDTRIIQKRREEPSKQRESRKSLAEEYDTEDREMPSVNDDLGIHAQNVYDESKDEKHKGIRGRHRRTRRKRNRRRRRKTHRRSKRPIMDIQDEEHPDNQVIYGKEDNLPTEEDSVNINEKRQQKRRKHSSNRESSSLYKDESKTDKRAKRKNEQPSRRNRKPKIKEGRDRSRHVEDDQIEDEHKNTRGKEEKEVHAYDEPNIKQKKEDRPEKFITETNEDEGDKTQILIDSKMSSPRNAEDQTNDERRKNPRENEELQPRNDNRAVIGQDATKRKQDDPVDSTKDDEKYRTLIEKLPKENQVIEKDEDHKTNKQSEIESEKTLGLAVDTPQIFEIDALYSNSERDEVKHKRSKPDVTKEEGIQLYKDAQRKSEEQRQDASQKKESGIGNYTKDDKVSEASIGGTSLEKIPNDKRDIEQDEDRKENKQSNSDSENTLGNAAEISQILVIGDKFYSNREGGAEKNEKEKNDWENEELQQYNNAQDNPENKRKEATEETNVEDNQIEDEHQYTRRKEEKEVHANNEPNVKQEKEDGPEKSISETNKDEGDKTKILIDTKMSSPRNAEDQTNDERRKNPRENEEEVQPHNDNVAVIGQDATKRKQDDPVDSTKDDDKYRTLIEKLPKENQVNGKNEDHKTNKQSEIENEKTLGLAVDTPQIFAIDALYSNSERDEVKDKRSKTDATKEEEIQLYKAAQRKSEEQRQDAIKKKESEIGNYTKDDKVLEASIGGTSLEKIPNDKRDIEQDEDRKENKQSNSDSENTLGNAAEISQILVIGDKSYSSRDGGAEKYEKIKNDGENEELQLYKNAQDNPENKRKEASEATNVEDDQIDDEHQHSRGKQEKELPAYDEPNVKQKKEDSDTEKSITKTNEDEGDKIQILIDTKTLSPRNAEDQTNDERRKNLRENEEEVQPHNDNGAVIGQDATKSKQDDPVDSTKDDEALDDEKYRTLLVKLPKEKQVIEKDEDHKTNKQSESEIEKTFGLAVDTPHIFAIEAFYSNSERDEVKDKRSKTDATKEEEIQLYKDAQRKSEEQRQDSSQKKESEISNYTKDDKVLEVGIGGTSLEKISNEKRDIEHDEDRKENKQSNSDSEKTLGNAVEISNILVIGDKSYSDREGGEVKYEKIKIDGENEEVQLYKNDQDNPENKRKEASEATNVEDHQIEDEHQYTRGKEEKEVPAYDEPNVKQKKEDDTEKSITETNEDEGDKTQILLDTKTSSPRNAEDQINDERRKNPRENEEEVQPNNDNGAVIKQDETKRKQDDPVDSTNDDEALEDEKYRTLIEKLPQEKPVIEKDEDHKTNKQSESESEKTLGLAVDPPQIFVRDAFYSNSERDEVKDKRSKIDTPKEEGIQLYKDVQRKSEEQRQDASQKKESEINNYTKDDKVLEVGIGGTSLEKIPNDKRDIEQGEDGKENKQSNSDSENTLGNAVEISQILVIGDKSYSNREGGEMNYEKIKIDGENEEVQLYNNALDNPENQRKVANEATNDDIGNSTKNDKFKEICLGSISLEKLPNEKQDTDYDEERGKNEQSDSESEELSSLSGEIPMMLKSVNDTNPHNDDDEVTDEKRKIDDENDEEEQPNNEAQKYPEDQRKYEIEKKKNDVGTKYGKVLEGVILLEELPKEQKVFEKEKDRKEKEPSKVGSENMLSFDIVLPQMLGDESSGDESYHNSEHKVMGDHSEEQTPDSSDKKLDKKAMSTKDEKVLEGNLQREKEVAEKNENGKENDLNLSYSNTLSQKDGYTPEKNDSNGEEDTGMIEGKRIEYKEEEEEIQPNDEYQDTTNKRQALRESKQDGRGNSTKDAISLKKVPNKELFMDQEANQRERRHSNNGSVIYSTTTHKISENDYNRKERKKNDLNKFNKNSLHSTKREREKEYDHLEETISDVLVEDKPQILEGPEALRSTVEDNQNKNEQRNIEDKKVDTISLDVDAISVLKLSMKKHVKDQNEDQQVNGPSKSEGEMNLTITDELSEKDNYDTEESDENYPSEVLEGHKKTILAGPEASCPTNEDNQNNNTESNKSPILRGDNRSFSIVENGRVKNKRENIENEKEEKDLQPDDEVQKKLGDSRGKIQTDLSNFHKGDKDLEEDIDIISSEKILKDIQGIEQCEDAKENEESDDGSEIYFGDADEISQNDDWKWEDRDGGDLNKSSTDSVYSIDKYKEKENDILKATITDVIVNIEGDKIKMLEDSEAPRSIYVDNQNQDEHGNVTEKKKDATVLLKKIETDYSEDDKSHIWESDDSPYSYYNVKDDEVKKERKNVYEDEASSIEESFKRHPKRRRKSKYDRRSEKARGRNKYFGSEEPEFLTTKLFDVDKNKGYQVEGSGETSRIDDTRIIQQRHLRPSKKNVSRKSLVEEYDTKERELLSVNDDLETHAQNVNDESIDEKYKEIRDGHRRIRRKRRRRRRKARRRSKRPAVDLKDDEHPDNHVINDDNKLPIEEEFVNTSEHKKRRRKHSSNREYSSSFKDESKTDEIHKRKNILNEQPSTRNRKPIIKGDRDRSHPVEDAQIEDQQQNAIKGNSGIDVESHSIGDVFVDGISFEKVPKKELVKDQEEHQKERRQSIDSIELSLTNPEDGEEHDTNNSSKFSEHGSDREKDIDYYSSIGKESDSIQEAKTNTLEVDKIQVLGDPEASRPTIEENEKKDDVTLFKDWRTGYSESNKSQILRSDGRSYSIGENDRVKNKGKTIMNEKEEKDLQLDDKVQTNLEEQRQYPKEKIQTDLSNSNKINKTLEEDIDIISPGKVLKDIQGIERDKHQKGNEPSNNGSEIPMDDADEISQNDYWKSKEREGNDLNNSSTDSAYTIYTKIDMENGPLKATIANVLEGYKTQILGDPEVSRPIYVDNENQDEHRNVLQMKENDIVLLKEKETYYSEGDKSHILESDDMSYSNSKDDEVKNEGKHISNEGEEGIQLNDEAQDSTKEIGRHPRERIQDYTNNSSKDNGDNDAISFEKKSKIKQVTEQDYKENGQSNGGNALAVTITDEISENYDYDPDIKEGNDPNKFSKDSKYDIDRELKKQKVAIQENKTDLLEGFKKPILGDPEASPPTDGNTQNNNEQRLTEDEIEKNVNTNDEIQGQLEKQKVREAEYDPTERKHNDTRPFIKAYKAPGEVIGIITLEELLKEKEILLNENQAILTDFDHKKSVTKPMKISSDKGIVTIDDSKTKTTKELLGLNLNEDYTAEIVQVQGDAVETQEGNHTLKLDGVNLVANYSGKEREFPPKFMWQLNNKPISIDKEGEDRFQNLSSKFEDLSKELELDKNKKLNIEDELNYGFSETSVLSSEANHLEEPGFREIKKASSTVDGKLRDNFRANDTSILVSQRFDQGNSASSEMGLASVSPLIYILSVSFSIVTLILTCNVIAKTLPKT